MVDTGNNEAGTDKTRGSKSTKHTSAWHEKESGRGLSVFRRESFKFTLIGHTY